MLIEWRDKVFSTKKEKTVENIRFTPSCELERCEKEDPMLDWTRLDNAAKIFPSAPRRGDTQVFRFSCELTTPVIPALLQRAA